MSCNNATVSNRQLTDLIYTGWLFNPTGVTKELLETKRNLFRPFRIPEPFQSTKDIFCIRMDRTVDTYRSVSINNLKIQFSNAPLHEKVQLRIHPDMATGISEIRFWHKDKLLDIQKVKTELIDPVHF